MEYGGSCGRFGTNLRWQNAGQSLLLAAVSGPLPHRGVTGRKALRLNLYKELVCISTVGLPALEQIWQIRVKARPAAEPLGHRAKRSPQLVRHGLRVQPYRGGNRPLRPPKRMEAMDGRMAEISRSRCCRWRRLVWGRMRIRFTAWRQIRWARFQRRAGYGGINRPLVAITDRDQLIAYIFEQMPAIRNLLGLGRTTPCRINIRHGVITAQMGDRGMILQPGGHRVGTPIRQQISGRWVSRSTTIVP